MNPFSSGTQAASLESIDVRRMKALHDFLDAQFTEIYLEFLERSQISLDENVREELRTRVFGHLIEEAFPALRGWKEATVIPAALPLALKAKMIEYITQEIRRMP